MAKEYRLSSAVVFREIWTIEKVGSNMLGENITQQSAIKNLMKNLDDSPIVGGGGT